MTTRLYFRDADPTIGGAGTVQPIAAGDRELVAQYPADSRRYELEQDEAGVRLFRAAATTKPAAAEPATATDSAKAWFRKTNRAACDEVAAINARNAAFWARK